MFYMNNEICGDQSKQECVDSTSSFAILNGRRNTYIISLNWLQFLMSNYLILTELFELFSEGFHKYFENWQWNLNDLIMPVSFMIGFYDDHDTAAVDFVRSMYTLTTMSLLFVFL